MFAKYISSFTSCNKHFLRILFAVNTIAMMTVSTSCKKLIEVDSPVTSVTGSSVYDNDGTAISAITGIYASMASGGFATGSKSLSLLCGLSADELAPYNGIDANDPILFYYRNALHADNTSTTPGTESWSQLYNYIYACNSAIEGLTASSKITAGIKTRLLGEAKFTRAFLYFYLVNLYGHVPLITTSDFSVNAHLGRAAKSEIFNLIISDLKEARVLLSEFFPGADLLSTTEERVRPTKWAAAALLARVYLYNEDYANAEIEATSIIDNTSLFTLSELNSTFLKNSSEAIWQLQPVVAGHNTEDAWIFIIPAEGPSSSHPVFISDFLLNAFEPNDNRRFGRTWIDSIIVDNRTYYFPLKYKSATQDESVTEYVTVLRLAEIFLIRAEARAHLNNVIGSQEDLNVIRSRAGLNQTPASDMNALLSAIESERQVELFTEFGHRWLDLKRTGAVNEIMQVVCSEKGGAWSPNWSLYPIWLFDIEKDPNLSQNPGY